MVTEPTDRRDDAGVAARALTWLRGEGSRWLDLLAELVSIESHPSQRHGVHRVAEVVCASLRDAGLETDRVPRPPLDDDLRWLAEVLCPEARYEDLADTFVARMAGTGSHGVLLLGDVDTAFPPGSLATFPFGVRDGSAFGPGVADAKGGLVVLIAGLHALRALDVPTPPISVVLCGDEQAGSLGSRSTVSAEAARRRWCLCLECARDGGKLMASRAHIGVGLVEATGRRAHAGTARGAGANAIDGLVAALPSLADLDDPSSGTLVTVTLIEGGTRRSVVPERATAVLDLRASDGTAWDRLVAGLEEAVRRAPADPGVRVRLRTAAHRPGFGPQAGSDLLRMVGRVAAGIGLELEAVPSQAAGSSAFAAAAGAAVVDGMGPIGGGLMTTDESVEVASITERAAVLAGVLHELAGGPEGGTDDAAATGETR